MLSAQSREAEAEQVCQMGVTDDKRKHVNVRPRTKRVLNSFIGFRTRYSNVFSTLPQKKRSGYLTELWREDPYKNKWALIAKVYSFVRDEAGATLSPFLDYACPALGLPAPQTYLSELNWLVLEGLDGQPSLIQGEKPVVREDQGCQTEFALLSACMRAGYRVKNARGVLRKLGGSARTIMTAPARVRGEQRVSPPLGEEGYGDGIPGVFAPPMVVNPANGGGSQAPDVSYIFEMQPGEMELAGLPDLSFSEEDAMYRHVHAHSSGQMTMQLALPLYMPTQDGREDDRYDGYDTMSWRCNENMTDWSYGVRG